jgi:hypothetical protein
MLNRLYLPFLGLLSVAAIAVSLVWPQGLGARSPGSLGHTPVQQTAPVQAAMQRENEVAQQRYSAARAAVRSAQSHAIAPNQ